MITSRGAFFLGLSLIVCTSIFIYGPQIGKLRYLTIPTNQGLFVLDTKTQVMNICTEKSCRSVPHEVSSTFVPGMQPTYGQMPMTPTNSLGIDENNTVPGFGYGRGVCVMPVPQQAIQMQQPQQPQPVVMEKKPEIEQTAQPQQPVRVAPPVATPPQRIEEQRPPVQTFQRPIATVVQRPMMPQRPVMTEENTEPERSEEETPTPRPMMPAPQTMQPRPIAPNPIAENRVNNDMEQLNETERKLFGR